MMQARAVLFDLDGTLVDSLPGIEFSVDCALADCNAPQRNCHLRPLIGPPIRTILGQLVPEADEERLTALEAAFRASYDSAGWRKTALHDNAIETLSKLRADGFLLFLITNKPQGPTRQIVQALNLSHLFTEVLCRDSRDPSYGSKAEMLREIVARQNLESRACLYVGDTSEDSCAALEAGIPFAIVAHGYGRPDTNGHEPASMNVNSLNELLNILTVMEMS